MTLGSTSPPASSTARGPSRVVLAAQVLAGLAGAVAALLFALQQAGVSMPVPLPPDTERLQPLSLLGHVLGALAVLWVLAGRGRSLAVLLGVLALSSLVVYPMMDGEGPVRGGVPPPVSLGCLLVAVAAFSYGAAHRLRQALPGAAGLALLAMSLGALGHYAAWLLDDTHLYLLRTAPTHVLPQVLLALTLVVMSLEPGGRRWVRRHRALLWWSGVFAAVLIGAWGLTTWSNALHVRHEATRRVEGLSKVLIEHFTRSLDPADLLLQQVVGSVARDGLPEPASAETRFAGVQLALRTLQQVDALSVFDAQRRLRFESRDGAMPPLLPAPLVASFEVLAKGTAGVFGPVLRNAAGQPTLLYSRRLTAPDGGFAGMVVVGMRSDYYRDFYRSLALGPEASVAVVARNGEAVLRYPALSLEAQARLQSARLLLPLPDEGGGVLALLSPLDGVPRLLAYRTTMHPPVVIFAGIGAAPLADVSQREFFASASLLAMALMMLAWAVTQQTAAAERERIVQQRLRQAHDEVQDSARHLSEIAATVPGLLYQWEARADGSRGFRYVSAHAEVLFGLSPERFGRLWWTRVHPADRLLVRETIRDAVAARVPWSVEGRVTDGAGNERWVRMMARPTQEQSDGVVYTGFVIDITAERHGQAELERLATTDSLTGLLTRRQFHVLAEREIARHQRSGEPMAVLMLDVDHFKRVNDSHGHACGDVVLVAVAAAMREALREVDVLGRFGGEEFAAVLGGADLDAAAPIAERLREACAAVAVPVHGGVVLRVTVSIGLTVRHPGEDRLDAALHRADAALYRAKQLGRNRVEHETRPAGPAAQPWSTSFHDQPDA